MNLPDYENDIRTLLMAFFFGEKIVYDSEEWTYCAEVAYSENRTKVSFSVCDRGGRKGAGKCACDLSEYKKTRNEIKRMVYGVLSDFTGQKLPWGTLTGIRPSKLPTAMFEDGASDTEAVNFLEETYLVSEEKAKLCTEVARNEQAVLSGLDYENSYSLYVGIPFCPSICAYCSFSSYPLDVWESRVDDYLDSLEREIAAASGMMGERHLLSFYMGGGTPTSLTASQLDRLLTCLETYFPLGEAKERTVEAGRPDTVTEDKLEVLLKHKTDRISINPQTMNQDTLDLIGRRHTVEDVYRAFELARRMGFKNINMDLIAGLPGEKAEHMRRTMDAVTGLGPENVTVHCLALKRAAFLNKNRELFPVAEADEVNLMTGIARRGAEKIGARPYYLYRQKNIAGNLENVGYARPGCEGLYNILIMEEKQSILALGAGAASKFVFEGENGTRIERVENVKSVKDYIERTDEMIARKNNFLKKEKSHF